jgi:hypothetical protein
MMSENWMSSTAIHSRELDTREWNETSTKVVHPALPYLKIFSQEQLNIQPPISSPTPPSGPPSHPKGVKLFTQLLMTDYHWVEKSRNIVKVDFFSCFFTHRKTPFYIFQTLEITFGKPKPMFYIQWPLLCNGRDT